jgi:methyl-accepting chemotaxis protein
MSSNPALLQGAQVTDTESDHDGTEPAHRLADIGVRASRLGLEIANVRGIVEDLGVLNGKLVETMKSVAGSASTAAEANAVLAHSMEDSRNSADAARQTLRDNAELVATTLAEAIDKMQALSQGAFNIVGSLETIGQTVAQVQAINSAIQTISADTQMIALNASVEAARAGEAGRSFGVIAGAIKNLAEQVRKFNNDNTANLATLKRTIGELLESARANAAIAQSAVESSNRAKDASGGIRSLSTSVQQLAAKIEAMVAPVQQNMRDGEQVSEELHHLSVMAENVDHKLADGRARAENILGISEDFLLFIAESGIETPDDAVIAICRRTAGEIGALFERAVADGTIGMADLFDEKYVTIPNTNPKQVMTRFTNFTDSMLPPVQEPVLKEHERIVFCAAVDRNGYLPTHNKIYSKPQGRDPAWNAANCRNRRIFDDRTGLSAGRNTRAFLLQTYRRDMGNGNFVLMKDVSAPITVNGRHWGGLRIGFKA